MISRRSMIRWAFALALLALPLGPAWAQATGGGAERFVSGVMENGLKKLSEKGISEAERRRTLIGLLNQYVDIAAVEKAVVGRYWERATPEQRVEYRRLFLDYLALSYSDSLKDFTTEVKIEFTGSERDAAGNIVVHGQIISPGDPVTLVDVILTERSGGEFLIIDATMAGVNVVEMWRSDFTSIIRNAGGRFEALIEALAKKISQIK
jgi:phospholipid transport system substrate-binding protein